MSSNDILSVEQLIKRFDNWLEADVQGFNSVEELTKSKPIFGKDEHERSK